MHEENESAINLLDYPPQIHELQHWKGRGQLRGRNDSWEGDFALSRLVNGRLRFIFTLHDWRKSSDSFVNLYSLEFNGVAEDGSAISVTGIHFDMRYQNNHDLQWICTGYAHAAARHIEMEADNVSLRCDLTNYSLHQRRQKPHFQLEGYAISIVRSRLGREATKVEEHAVAYQHASLSSSFIIENIPFNQVEKAIECLQEVASLLAIACRGHVAIIARHVLNQENVILDSKFDEPPFTDRRWGRPLIPPQNIEGFLQATYPADKDRVQKLELAFIIDHYLQALTLRSIWPQSVGIFTAMESLKSAFYEQDQSEGNESYIYWVVPPDEFESNEEMGREMVEVLTKHFPRFGNLNQSEKNSLKDQIRKGLKRRSYKTQLKRMLDLLTVEYSSNELQFFVNTRNKLIHEGTPVPANTPLDEYDEKNKVALEHVKKAVSLFERTLLAFLKYDGPRELYDEGLK